MNKPEDELKAYWATLSDDVEVDERIIVATAQLAGARDAFEDLEYTVSAAAANLGLTELVRLYLENEHFRETLVILSKLGAGGKAGNSTGNCIALDALKC